MRRNNCRGLGLASVALLLTAGTFLSAKPITEAQVQKAVEKFSKKKAKGLDKFEKAKPGSTKKEILYYVTHLEGGGSIIAAPDDSITPVIAFKKNGKLSLKESHPLKKLLDFDMAQRMKKLNNPSRQSDSEREANQALWASLLDDSSETLVASRGLSQLDDIRVDPLAATQWSQSTVSELEGSKKVFNIFTPKNYMCGCVATAMGQLMHFYKWPSRSIGETAFNVVVDGENKTLTTRGGDGQGGAYDWRLMVSAPDDNISAEQAEMIGSLVYDAGLSVGMNYTPAASWANVFDCAKALRDVFKYSNAIGWEDPLGSAFNEAGFDSTLNSNLDAGCPVIFGLSGDSGHAVVCDGYGWHAEMPYHHINMGWADAQDIWYNLPLVDGKASYAYFKSIVYNIYKTGKGEIVSGRVLTDNGSPIEGAKVSISYAKSGEHVATVATNVKGIYAFKNLPSAQPYKITAEKENWTFDPIEKVPVGTSKDSGENQIFGLTANKWGQNLKGRPVNGPEIQSHPANVTINAGEIATLQVTATGTGLRYTWYLGESGDTSEAAPGDNEGNVYKTPALTMKTSYWVRVTDSKGAFKDSETATVDVKVIPGPKILTQPKDVVIDSGETATLTVVAKGKKMVYDWFKGESGDTGQPAQMKGSDSFTTPKLKEDASYWVRITDADGHRVNSHSARVTINQVSDGPEIITQPKSIVVKPGQTATLTVVAKGKRMKYEWYRGESGDTSQVAKKNGQDSFTTPPLKSSASYWVRITDKEGASADSETADVIVRKN